MSEVPALLKRLLPDASAEAVGGGCSGATLYRCRAGGIERAAKWAPAGSGIGLSREAARLDWAAGRIAAPRLCAFARNDSGELLVMEWARGRTLVEALAEDGIGTARRLGDALAALHATPFDGCPFDATGPAELARARRNVEAGLVDEDDFDEERHGRTAASILEEIAAHVPSPARVCLTHGDPCLPNVLLDCDGAVWIDLGRLGVGDPARDVALARRSLRDNGGGAAELAAFDAAYGVLPAEENLRWYLALDELF
jgi:kanamycin kinase/aminoglycoside 3'-phosphotransferase-2